VSGNFTNVVVGDFEYEITDGDLPNVLCMVAHVLNENLQHVRPSAPGAVSLVQLHPLISGRIRCLLLILHGQK